jgi:hypothetical protein
MMTIAESLFNDKFRISYQFDGEVSVQDNGTGEFKRAVGWGGTKNTFTWKRFITLEDSYNPNPGGMNPWCLKNWYKWGCRKFHFHNPFGKVALGKKQQLVYEVDQILTAKNGLTLNGEVQNTKMPWLVNDFVPVIKALTTGQQGTLDQATWDSWTTGTDAWFNPAEPIDLIVYIGSMADPAISDEAYKEYILRWADHFKRSPSGALTRLKSSVQPLIDANCKIAFDACVAAAGSVPGKYVPLDRQSEALQKGWWSFWTWLNKKVGKSRIYVESHPFRNNGMDNPYLGWNVIADDEWAYSPCCPIDPNKMVGPHATSEMGQAEFWRCLWQIVPTRTPLISRTNPKGNTEPERYYFLRNDKSAVTVTSEYDPAFTEMRLEPPTCCAQGHNYYWYDIYDSIIAYHLTTRQDIRGEPNPSGNVTKQGILVPCQLLQVLPESFSGDSRWGEQFGVKYPTSAAFVKYLDSVAV